MAEKKVSELPTITVPAAGDFVILNDVFNIIFEFHIMVLDKFLSLFYSL